MNKKASGLTERQKQVGVSEFTHEVKEMKSVTWTVVPLLLAAACSPISQQAEQNLAQPINCATAIGDIRVLQSEKASVLTQIESGVTSVDPASAVLSTVTGSEMGKLKVASGDYNRMIDEKIAAIKQTCGIP